MQTFVDVEGNASFAAIVLRLLISFDVLQLSIRQVGPQQILLNG